MTIPSGTRFGPYEILAPLGAGGMGEVYRARDPRLGREVAIKVLPSHLSSNPQLRERFDREARAISGLSHPHICTVYDVGHQDGIDFLVMEYLEGETLADRLLKGPLALEQVIRYGAEIAEALDKAHRQGIVHRDLKPGNVMITKSGAKVLDFGLARYVAPSPGAFGATLSPRGEGPTEHKPLTQEGTILGTIQYMAPEQLEEKEADARTDIFALGAILYEMATGKHAFEGKSKASLIASIMSAEPAPISVVQPMTPPALDRIVRTCLEKDPDERWQSAHDVARELKWISDSGSQAAVAAHLPVRRAARWLLPIAAFVTGSVLTFLLTRERDSGPAPIRFTISPPELLAAADDSESIGIAISPNGRALAFTGMTGGSRMLFVRPLDGFTARVLPQTQDATFPFWSPDGRMIGFFAEGKLKKVDVSGGTPQTICAAPYGRGGTWSRNDLILFSPDFRSPLYRVSARGGQPEPATQLKRSENEVSHRWPVFLPNGTDFLYYTMGSKRGIHAASIDSRETRFIVDGSNAAYVASGMLVYARDKALVAQPFDPEQFRLSGTAVTIADEVGRYGESGPTGYSTFSVADSGVVAFRPIELARTQLIWFDSALKELGRVGPPGIYLEPTLSPDGSQISISRMDPVDQHTDVWTVDLTRGVFSRVTYGSGESVLGLWSPDGSRIAFSSDRSGTFDLYEKLANGSGPERLLYRNSLTKYGDDWSPDGQFIVYEELHPQTKTDLWVLRLSDRKPIPFVVTPFHETHAQFSRNGRFIAYSSDESGVSEVSVQSFPPTAGKWQISTAGGDQAIWGRDGKTLFYVAPDRTLMKVEVSTAGGFRAGNPVPLFKGPFPPTALTTSRNTYIASSDGKRFLINASLGGGSSPIYVIVNWPAELK